MQIIAAIPHGIYKITVFKNGLKYSVQLEGKFLQMIFRLPELDAFDSNAKVLDILNKDLLKHAIESIHKEEMSMNLFLKKYEEDDYFETII